MDGHFWQSFLLYSSRYLQIMIKYRYKKAFFAFLNIKISNIYF